MVGRVAAARSTAAQGIKSVSAVRLGRVIDVHAHLFPPELMTRGRGSLTVARERAGHVVQIGPFRSRPIPPLLRNIETRLHTMEAQRVDIQVLSGWTELLGYELPVAVAAESAREQNRAMAAVVDRDPDRFVGLATVPLQDPEVAVKVLEEAVRDLGLPGVQIGTHVAGRNLDDPSLDPFWAALEDLHSFVLIHPAQSQVGARERLGNYYFENLIGNPFETAVAGASLMFGGVLERHPGLVVCLAHGGGFLPYQLGRLVRGYQVRPESRVRLVEGVQRSFERLYFDSIVHSQANLRHLLSLVGPARVLLGSDYPFDMGDDDPIGSVDGLRLDPLDRDAILGATARRLFGW
jgi:aminocarboxymuconate-semialdehyde decarboxylase